MSVNFDDTKITFRSKSLGELQVSNVIFSIINRPLIVFIGTAIIKWALHFRLPIKGLIKATLLLNTILSGQSFTTPISFTGETCWIE